MNAIKGMMGVCKPNFTEKRDKAIILMLLDTGLRASELMALDKINLDPISGVIQIIQTSQIQLNDIQLLLEPNLKQRLKKASLVDNWE